MNLQFRHLKSGLNFLNFHGGLHKEGLQVKIFPQKKLPGVLLAPFYSPILNDTEVTLDIHLTTETKSSIPDQLYNKHVSCELKSREI